jgi:NIMA (never in mitosis gene a)-related kinase
MEGYESLGLLGRGSFGEVTKVLRKKDGRHYAVKKVQICGASLREQAAAINEVKVLALLDCEYVVKYYDSWVESSTLHLVMEYCNRGDLASFLSAIRRGEGPSRAASTSSSSGRARLSEEQVWSLTLPIILGLYHIHASSVLHRDLKPENIFLTDHGCGGQLRVKLGDFSSSLELLRRTAMASTVIGTPLFMAPELCQGREYNDRSDVWSLGVVIYECIMLHLPFEAPNQAALVLKIISSRYRAIPHDAASCSLRSLVRSLLTRDMSKRPNVHDILSRRGVQEKLVRFGFGIPDGISPCATTSTRSCVSKRVVRKISSAPAARRDVGSHVARDVTGGGGNIRAKSAGSVRGTRVRGLGGNGRNSLNAERKISARVLQRRGPSCPSSAIATGAVPSTSSSFPVPRTPEARHLLPNQQPSPEVSIEAAPFVSVHTEDERIGKRKLPTVADLYRVLDEQCCSPSSSAPAEEIEGVYDDASPSPPSSPRPSYRVCIAPRQSLCWRVKGEQIEWEGGGGEPETCQSESGDEEKDGEDENDTTSAWSEDDDSCVLLASSSSVDADDLDELILNTTEQCLAALGPDAFLEVQELLEDASLGEDHLHRRLRACLVEHRGMKLADAYDGVRLVHLLRSYQESYK